MLTASWQDIATWIAIFLASVYLVRHFRRHPGIGSSECGGCTHCPMSGTLGE